MYPELLVRFFSFLLAIVLSVFHRFTDSDHHFDIFNLFLHSSIFPWRYFYCFNIPTFPFSPLVTLKSIYSNRSPHTPTPTPLNHEIGWSNLTGWYWRLELIRDVIRKEPYNILYSLTFFSYQSMKIIGLLKVCFCWSFIGYNLYLMWSSLNCRHNVRHIRTIPFLLPPDWDGWPLNFTITHFL